MNIFKKIETQNDPLILKCLEETKNNKKEISNIIFDKEKILKFNDEYEVFEPENLGYIMKAVDEILCDEEYTLLSCAMYYFLKKDISISCLKPEEDGTLKSEFALMPPLIANVIDFCNDAINRGIEKEIIKTTLKVLNMYLVWNVNRKGRIGTSGYHFWLPLYAKGRIFRIGAFQFELRDFRGEKAIGVHIPKGTKLEVLENLLNFKEALEFFNKYYSEYDFKYFVCESWLLNPHIEEIMGRKTNITRFGDMFERFEMEEEEFGVYISVFNVLEPKDIDSLVEETTLQKGIKKYIKDGNKFKDYGGFIRIEKFNDMI